MKMTQAELKNLFRSTLQAQRTIAQEYTVLDAIVDFIAQALTSGIPAWTSALTFNTDGSGDGSFSILEDTDGNIRFWKTKTDSNINNSPPTNPVTTENTDWIEVSPSDGSAIKEWAPGIYGPGLVIVYYDVNGDGTDPALYILLEPTRPFESTNFTTELAATKWKKMSGSSSGGSGFATADTYADIAELISEQGAQVAGAWYLVEDASADATVTAGWAIYSYKGTTAGDLTDYVKIMEQESLDLDLSSKENVSNKTSTIAGNESSTSLYSNVKGIVDWVKQGLPALLISLSLTKTTLIDADGVLSNDSADSNKLKITTWTNVWANYLKAKADALYQVILSIASQSDMITGTDNAKMVTALAVESKRSILSNSFSNAATGSSTIDCGSRQENKVVYNTTVTGAITIALSNDSNLEMLNIIIPITGANIAITFPSNVRMRLEDEVSAGDGWYYATNILQVSSVGTADTHEFSLIKVGSVFRLNYGSAARA